MKENEFDELLQDLNERSLQQYARRHLSEEKQKRLQEILSDPDKLERIMKSKKARELMEQFKKGKKNG